MTQLSKRSAGLQGRETSSAEVTIYTHGNEPGLNQPAGGKYLLNGRRNAPGEAPTLISVDTHKVLGGPAGGFQVVVKAPRSLDFGQWVSDNDWVDIVLGRHERKFHVMRGLVDTVQRTSTVRDGATTQDWMINGRDFQKVFEDTLVFFNRFAAENVWGGATMQAMLAQETLFNVAQQGFEAGSVAANIYGFLNALLEQIGDFGRSTWELPASLPGAFTDDDFVDVLRFNFLDFLNKPRRLEPRPWFASFRGVSDTNIWALAQEWSDPQFCELFCELMLDNGERFPGPDDETGADLNGSIMTVVLRDRPFPTAEDPHGTVSAGPWWNLPLYLLSRQEVVTDDVVRSGRERKNAFLFQPQITQELLGQSIQVAKPMWDAAAIRRHGVRPMYATSKYTVLGDSASDVVSMAESQRRRLRDWFCLNHLFYSGPIQLPYGRPDIKIGSRARVVSELGEDLDETYYVESVAHSWRYPQAMRTTLGATRGWIGTDASLRRVLNEARDRFVDSEEANPDDVRGLEVALRTA